jgi:N-acetylmuramoyl-L-alanine amidase
MEIQKQFIDYNYSPRNEKIEYIIIHDVGAISTAKNNRDYFAGGNRGASADFFVDSNNIIQLIDYTKNFSWAVGDGKGQYEITNKNSISIELCLEANLRPSSATVTNTINLVRKLLVDLNLTQEKVLRHYDASRKNCPQSMSADNWSLWHEFKKQLVPVVKESITTQKVNYCLEFQKWYNKVTQTGSPLIEDGKWGNKTFAAINTMESLIKGGK